MPYKKSVPVAGVTGGKPGNSAQPPDRQGITHVPQTNKMHTVVNAYGQQSGINPTLGDYSDLVHNDIGPGTYSATDIENRRAAREKAHNALAASRSSQGPKQRGRS